MDTVTLSRLRVVAAAMEATGWGDDARRLLSAFLPVTVTVAVYRHMETAHWKDGEWCHRHYYILYFNEERVDREPWRFNFADDQLYFVGQYEGYASPRPWNAATDYRRFPGPVTFSGGAGHTVSQPLLQGGRFTRGWFAAGRLRSDTNALNDLLRRLQLPTAPDTLIKANLCNAK